MSYLIYIERHAEDIIKTHEWINAINASSQFRFSKSDEVAITNPKTGETITRQNEDFDVEHRIAIEGRWVSALRWDSAAGRATTTATRTFDQRPDPYRRALVELATALTAIVIGQEGETYD